MSDFLKKNSIVLVIYALLLALSAYFILTIEKQSLHLYINEYVGNRYLNAFFYYITYLGDGRLAAFILLFILLLNVRTGIYTVASFLSAALVAFVLKRLIFEDVNRPWYDLQNKFPLKVVDHVDLHIHYSFPSGHATQAFAILMCLAFLVPGKALKFLFFSLALFTSFSRVYLSQHWLVDVTAGSLIGTLCAISWYFVFISRNNYSHLNKPLMALKKA